MLPDRLNPRVWLRSLVIALRRWLMKPTPAEIAASEAAQAKTIQSLWKWAAHRVDRSTHAEFCGEEGDPGTCWCHDAEEVTP